MDFIEAECICLELYELSKATSSKKQEIKNPTERSVGTINI